MNTIATPFGLLLMFLYELVNNYGVAIILLAIVIKVILLPFQMKSKRGMMQQAMLQPRLKELEKKHGANKAKYNEEVQKLYKEEKINPASGCLWSFITLPIMLALFYAIRQPLTLMMGVPADLLQEGGAIFNKLAELGFTTNVSEYYEQIAQSQFISAHFADFAALSDKLRYIDFNFLGIDLGAQPQWNFLWTTSWSDAAVWLPGFVLFLIPILSGGVQMLATAINQKINPVGTPENQGGSMKMMMYMMPLVSIYIAFITPGALGFYWTLSALFQLLQDIWLTKRYRRIIDAEEAVKSVERRKREAELEAKRSESERKKAEGIVEKNPNVSKRKKQMTEKQEQLEKAAEWQKRNEPPPEGEPSREGNRRYARGRAYDPGRYSEKSDENPEAEDEIESEDEAVSAELPEVIDEAVQDTEDAEDTGDESAAEDGEEDDRSED